MNRLLKHPLFWFANTIAFARHTLPEYRKWKERREYINSKEYKEINLIVFGEKK